MVVVSAPTILQWFSCVTGWMRGRFFEIHTSAKSSGIFQHLPAPWRKNFEASVPSMPVARMAEMAPIGWGSTLLSWMGIGNLLPPPNKNTYFQKYPKFSPNVKTIVELSILGMCVFTYFPPVLFYVGSNDTLLMTWSTGASPTLRQRGFSAIGESDFSGIP